MITPVFNSISYLAETIRSVEAQSWQDFEHLLVDDGSTDGSIEMIKDYVARDKRAKLIVLEKNGGVSAARNEGIRQASGQYISFLDSDDWWEDNKLESQHQLIAASGAKFVYASYHHRLENGNYVKTIMCPSATNFEQMLRGSVVGCLTVAIHRDVIQAKRFKNVFHEDYLFWLEILRDHHLTARGVTQPLANYRLRPNSRSANKREAAQAQWRIYREHLGLGLWQTLPLFVSYAVAGLRKHRSAV